MSSANRPYGQQEVDPNVERGLIGANDGLAYKKEKKTVVVDTTGISDETVEEPTPEQPEALSAEEHNEKYKKLDWKKRYDELKRHHDRKVNGFKEEINNLKQARPKFKPPKTPEELATFRAENPDIYDVVETVAHLRTSDEMAQLQETVQKLKMEAESQKQARAFAELKMMVPDYEEISTSDDFKGWAAQQPLEIQKWIFENPDNAQLAAKAINLYKADRGMQSRSHTPTPQQRRQPSAADAVVTGRGQGEPNTAGRDRVFTRSELKSMNWKEYEKLQGEIDKAFREGRVIEG